MEELYEFKGECFNTSTLDDVPLISSFERVEDIWNTSPFAFHLFTHLYFLANEKDRVCTVYTLPFTVNRGNFVIRSKHLREITNYKCKQLSKTLDVLEKAGYIEIDYIFNHDDSPFLTYSYYIKIINYDKWQTTEEGKCNVGTA